MTLPISPLFPEEFDGDHNLYVVHDSLRLKLAENYEPGDTSVVAEGDLLVISRIPPSGCITLTEQCSEVKDRAVTIHYGSFDSETITFSDLTVLSTSPDAKKFKGITAVTVNVMAEHHNCIKDTLIAVQEYCGVKGTEDTAPFGDTLEGRTNFLRRLVLQPKAWFTADKRIGNVPLCVTFEDQSFRLGTDGDSGDIKLTWDFGDQTTSVVSIISATSQVPDASVDVLVLDQDGGTIRKCYHQPGIYDVKLTVENDFGSDTVILPDFINARVKAPDEAIIRFIENTSNQDATPGVPPDGPFDIVPTIRSPINTLIQIEVPSGENPATPNVSYAGEALNGAVAIDPITDYNWFLGDDLNHPNIAETKASFSVGGIYDLKLRVDTEFGAFRITTYENAIDIVENVNLWLWVFNSSTTVRAYEYGLISETFKLTSAASLTIGRNYDFLEGRENSEKQITEFKRNVGFARRGSLPSGQGGTAFLYWATGRNESDPIADETIDVAEFDGFLGTYISRPSITRAWNWAHLSSSVSSFFVFGDIESRNPNTSPTNITKTTFDLANLSVAEADLTAANYLNGASELEQNPSVYDNAGESLYGHFSVYRTAWKDSTGYLARNDGVGPFFRIKSFYRTEGTVVSPFQNIRKMQDIQGPTKIEAQMTNLSAGLYVLNNSGSVSKFDDNTNVWTTGGPGVNSLLYRNLQDTSVSGFDDAANNLLLVSDSDKRAYLSFDYSVNAFLKFNEIDLSFRSLVSRPEGEQWLAGVY